MALFKNWKPKTIAGKILKGTTIAVGGAAVLASGVGAIAGAVGGAGMLAGAAGGLGTVVRTVGKAGKGTKTVLSKVGGAAAKLVTGQNKENRGIIAQAKEEARKAKEQQELINKLKKQGLSEAEAYARAGLTYYQYGDTKEVDAGTGFLSELRNTFAGSDPDQAGTSPKPDNQKLIMYAGLGLLGLLVLPKLVK